MTQLKPWLTLLFSGHLPATDDGGGGDNWTTGAISCAVRPVKSSSSTNQHPVFYRPDALPVTQPTVPQH